MRSFVFPVCGQALRLLAAALALGVPAASAQIHPIAVLESGFTDDALAFAEEVASIGDYDGDGTPDIVGFFMGNVSTRHTGIVYSGRTFEMLNLFSHGGRRVDVGFDVTGDGVREIAVGTDQGAYVLNGASGNLHATLMWPRHTGHGSYGSSVVSIENAVRGPTADYVVAASTGDFYGRPNGILYVFDGANGDTSLYIPIRPPYPAFTGSANGFRNLFSLGDFDRDGYGDFAVGAPQHRPTGNRLDPWGRVYIFSGLTGGFKFQLVNPDTAINGQFDGFGRNLLAVADMNGDAYRELIVASPHPCTFVTFSGGCLYRYDGRTGALLDTLVHPQNEITDGEFGAALAEISDIDGDDVPELVVGAPSADNNRCCSWPRDAGLVYVYSGRTLALLHTLESPSKPTNIYAYFGRSVANAGDLDGDGLDEILVGAPNEITARRPADNAPTASGRIYVFNLARPEGTAADDEMLPGRVEVSISPNPVRDAASVRIVLGQGGPVEAVLYDVLGREVRRVVDAVLPPGTHTEYVDVQGLASGRYALRLTTHAGVTTRLVTVAR